MNILPVSVLCGLTAASLLSSASAFGETLTLKDGGNAKGLRDNVWSDDSTVASADNDYLVTNAKFIYVSNLVDYSGQDKELNHFVGNSLTIGGSSSDGYFYQYGSYIAGKEAKLDNAGLVLARGGWILKYGYGYRLEGPVSVTATEAAPFRLYTESSDTADASGLTLLTSFGGSGYFRICPQMSYGKNLTLTLNCDCSGFSGNLSVESGSNKGGNWAQGRLRVKTATCTGTIDVGGGSELGFLQPTDVFTAGTVNLGDGARLLVPAADAGTGEERTVSCGRLVATDGFSCSGVVEIRFDYNDSLGGGKADSFVLLTVPSSAELETSMFTYVSVDGAHPDGELSVVADAGASTKSLVLSFKAKRPVLTLKASSNAVGVSGSTWSDDSVGTVAGYDYLVKDGLQLYVSSINSVDNGFHGEKLIIGDGANGSSGDLYQYGGWPLTSTVLTFPNDGIELVRGNWRLRYAYAYVCQATAFAVTAAAESPFQVYCEYWDAATVASLQWNGPLSGNGALTVSAGVKTGCATNFCLKVNGDASSFTGALCVTGGVSSTTVTRGMQCVAGLVVTNTVIPASVVLCGHGYLGTFTGSDTVTIGSLTLSEDSELQVKFAGDGCSRYVVTDAWSMTGRARVSFTGFSDAVGLNGGSYDILTVPAGQTLSAEDFTADLSGFPSFANPRLVVSGDSRTLSLVLDDYERVDMTVSDVNTGLLTDYSSAMTNAAQWSDNAEPHADVHYRIGSGMVLRTPMDLTGSASFAGDSLTLADGAEFCILYRNYTIPLLRFVNGGFVYPKYNNNGVTLHSDVELISGTTTFRPYAGGLFTVDGTISGKGSLVIVGNALGSSNPGGYTELLGDNASFGGRLTVTMGTAGSYCPAFGDKYYSRLYVSDGNNIGGAMSPADPKGFTLENYSQLITRGSVTFDEPTRGVFINSVGRLYVTAAAHTLTLSSPLAVNGQLYKEGLGTLALGNPQPTFGATAVEVAPGAETANRRFVLSAGHVRIDSAWALNGLDVSVENADSTFAIDVKTDKTDLAEYGLVDVLSTEMPFSVKDSSCRFRFRLTSDSTKPAWHERSVGLCTVRSEHADAVDALLDVSRASGVRGFSFRAVRREPVVLGDVPCVTFKADLTANQGFAILVR